MSRVCSSMYWGSPWRLWGSMKRLLNLYATFLRVEHGGG
jgi:hypothetical protein